MKSRTIAIFIALFVIIVFPPPIRARQLAARTTNAAGDIAEQVNLLVGRSTVLRMDRPIIRVSLSTPDIADALVTSPYEVLIHGKTQGTISMLIWANNGTIKNYDVAVHRDLSELDAQLRKLFPGEPITVGSNGKDVVLSGIVSTKYIVDRASSLAVGYVEKADQVVNLLRQQEGVATDQVMLKVRFAEVSRSALQDLGASFFKGPTGKDNWIGSTTTQQFASPSIDQKNGLVFSDLLNLFAFNTEEQLGTLVKALQSRGLFQSLAEPNLITQDGKEASFLAGGEYPFPVVQGTAGNQSVTITFKEFGVRLHFTPTVLGGDMIHLKVAPEVSTLDFSNAILLQGFRIPALSTRRTESEVELRDGQTFAIAGLLDNRVNETMSRVPGIGDIPILGYLFRSRAYQKNSTELVVMITPRIVRRDSSGVTPNLPGLVQPFLGPQRRLPTPPPAFNEPESRQGQQAQPASPSPAAGSGASNDGPAVTTPVAAAVAPQPQTPHAAIVEDKNQDQKKLKEERQRAEDAKKQQEALAKEAANADARRLETERAQTERAREEEQRRTEANRKVAEKRGREQAEIDRQRHEVEQKQAAQAHEVEQKQAAQAREVADKLSRENARRQAEQTKLEQAHQAEERKLADKHRKDEEKLAREHAGRDAEIAKVLQQYKKLTDQAAPANGLGSSTSAPAQ